AGTQRIFASVQAAGRETGIDLGAIQRAAAAIHGISRKTSQGFGNHNFAVLNNCPPQTPLFPAAYHNGGPPAYALGLECADLVFEAFSAAAHLDEAAMKLEQALLDTARTIQRVTADLAGEGGFHFAGIDFSTTPYPKPGISTAAALEGLVVERFGASGTLLGAAAITGVLRRVAAHSEVSAVGFSGLLLPMMEDAVVAERAAEGGLSLEGLLLYSAVCGTGLDTIVLPGGVAVRELAAVLLDVATLAVVLDKPLTARLVPVPGGKAGDLTDFDYEYFANTRIMAVRGVGGRILNQLSGTIGSEMLGGIYSAAQSGRRAPQPGANGGAG
ncbi:MAG: DUF711 family protein, partial [Thermaerobacterales bacterium]